MKNELWEVGPRVARYRCIPDNDEARRQLEAIGHVEFEAISIGRAGNGPQVAIIPLDESSREIAAHIVALHNATVPKFEPGRLAAILAKPLWERTTDDLNYVTRLEDAEREDAGK